MRVSETLSQLLYSRYLFVVVPGRGGEDVALPSGKSSPQCRSLRAGVDCQYLRAYLQRVDAHRRQAHADLLGRRRIFIIGLVIFTLSRIAGVRAPSSNSTIPYWARLVLRCEAALMNPATLSIIVTTFPPRQRAWQSVSGPGLSARARNRIRSRLASLT